MNNRHYPVPAAPVRTTIVVRGSRFIAQVIPTATVTAAREAIAAARAEMPDATHHCYAYLIGYGTSTIAGMSDDGEPAGTAGRPILSVLRGADLGDTTVIVTRYFGGTLLGVGRLARAYSEAASAALAIVPRTQRVIYQRMIIRLPYTDYAGVRRLLAEAAAAIVAETFTTEVEITADIPVDRIHDLGQRLGESSAGRAQMVPATNMV
ncbi:MAG: IMPACT family protein [Chloroflexus sp.]